MKNIKKNDQVIILAGKDKGKTGKVIAVEVNDKIIIEKINLVKRATKRSQNFQGGIIEKPASINISNVSLVCPSCNKATRVDKTAVIDNKRVRTCKKCRELIDNPRR